MDIQSTLLSGSHLVDTFVEAAPYTNNINSMRSSYGLVGSTNGKTDALEAVKMDPAVLEAQVTVETRGNVCVESQNNCRSDADERASVDTEDTTPSSSKGFEDMVMQHEAALLSLTPNQLETLMQFADVLRRQRMMSRKYIECAFCKNNGKSVYWYTSHSLKDGRGRVLCPVLRSFRCPRCGATGGRAHTIKYCPEFSDTESTTPSNS